MWFGTSGGLSRFDGYDFKVYRHDPDDSTSLNNNKVSSLLEESNEYLLVGTYSGGLNRFNFATGRFTNFVNNPEDPNSISDNRINVIYKDNDGIIWIGTHNGLNVFNPLNGTFKVFKQDVLSPGSKKDQINTVFHDKNGIRWIGTNDGLYQFNLQKQTFKKIELNLPVEPIENKHNIINCITEDHIGVLWIGTDYLLFKYYNGNYEWVAPDSNRSKYPSNYFINEFLESKDANGYHFWIATNWGLNKYDFKSGIYEPVHTDPDNPESLLSDQINALLLDENDLLWIACPDGVNVLNLHTDPFKQVFIPLGKNTTSYSAVTFFEDKEKNFWIGSANGGLLKYNKDLNPVERFRLILDNRQIVNYSIFKIFEDSAQNMWVGINRRFSGNYLFDRNNKSFTKLEYNTKDSLAMPTETKDILESKTGIIWFTTNKGLYGLYGHRQKDFLLKPCGDELLSKTRINDLYNDRSGNTWISSQEGLYRMHVVSRDSVYFEKVDDCSTDQSCLRGKPNCVLESKDGTYWVGTSEGLFKMNVENYDYTEVFGQNELVGENIILSIVEDDKGYLWMNTWKGLVRFNPRATTQETPKLFDISDGLPYVGYLSTPLYKSNDGRIFVPGRGGRQNGFYYFHSDSIYYNTRIPPVMITDLKVRNEPYVSDSSITAVKHIELSYNQNFLSFEFVALDYSDPAKNQYAYYLEGLDDDWIYLGNRRYVNYTSVPPGNYIFRVRGSNNDGYWNEAGTSVAITILPPPWKTWWAYIIYMLMFAAVIFTIIHYYLRRQRLLQTLELEQVEAEKLKELDSMKSRFFANISHEFRTPLTLILGPLQKLTGEIKDDANRQQLSLMQRNVLRLRELINQLLDLSKLEAGKMQLQCGEMNLTEWVRMHIQSFESLAKQRKIDFVFNAEQEKIVCFFDPEKMARVLNNLLSNAFKFTGEGGRISVTVGSSQSTASSRQSAVHGRKLVVGGELTEDWRLKTTDYTGQCVAIKISDTGTGIPPEKLEHIFNRFYQADDTSSRRHEGTGIGLALVKELVELHHGDITVESVENKGTTFTIFLPLGKEHLKPEEIVAHTPKVHEPEIHPESQLPERTIVEITPEEKNKTGKPILLIVEDNVDMRHYIRGFFAETFKIIEAENGEKGLEQAIKQIPDIIISDVMMPVMDGYELCRKIKTDERTSHIPLILLTARSSGADKIEGLETGADDFVIKPFEGRELQVRVKNLIDLRKKLQQKFVKNVEKPGFSEWKKLPGNSITSYDKKFLQKAVGVVEEHLQEPEFSVEQFASDMALSRVQLHRKLRALINQSATEFIRTIRLNTAAVLLINKTANISEICYDVGFNNHAYFTSCFHKKFGMTPTEYSNQSPGT